jgi:hypothetical protein
MSAFHNPLRRTTRSDLDSSAGKDAVRAFDQRVQRSLRTA